MLKSVRIAVCFLFLCSPSWLMSQIQELEFRQRNFPGREAEFDKALDAYKKGDYYFLRGPVYYPQALENYLIAQEFNPNNADLNRQIGLCYLSLQKDRLKALPYLERAQALKPEADNDFFLALGNAYQYNLEFEKAILIYENYIKGLPSEGAEKQRKDAEKFIEECRSGIELVKKPVRVRIDNLGPAVNSSFPDYAPVLSENETKLLFTSRRDETTGKMVDPVDSLFFEDIYLTFKIDNEWAPAKNVGKPINQDEHDATVYLSPDGKTLLLYRTNNGGDIYESKLEGIRWSNPRPLTEINTPYYETHATYSPDGKYLYFISNRKEPPGYGGKDIYIADVDPTGRLSNIRNAGSVVNTPYDEDGVYCHRDGKTIFFSSKGHNSMGGYDIFQCQVENGIFTQPVNMGFPINSPEDDVFFVMGADNRHAYFASYREEGFGDKDIYRMSFLDEVEYLTSLQIALNDTNQKRPLNGTIRIKDIETGQIITERQTENGETISNIPSGKIYEITVESDRYLPYTEVIELPFEAGDQIVLRNIELSRDNQTLVKGTLTDRKTKIPVAGELEFQDLGTREIVKTAIADKNGEFKVMLPPGRDYVAQIKSRNYVVASDTLRIPKLAKEGELSGNFELDGIDRTVMSMLKGTVLDVVSGEKVKANISISEYGNIPVLVYPKPGYYDCIVFNGTMLTIQVDADGYLPYTAQVHIPASGEKQVIEHNILLAKTERGAKIVLNNIFFDFNKSTLRPISYKSLNNLLQTMKRYPGMQIEISGHTDNVGSMVYNQKLSDNRAVVVKSYLVRNGISPKRILAVGKSFRQPVASNDTNEGRQLNRRTEIRILSMTEGK